MTATFWLMLVENSFFALQQRTAKTPPFMRRCSSVVEEPSASESGDRVLIQSLAALNVSEAERFSCELANAD